MTESNIFLAILKRAFVRDARQVILLTLVIVVYSLLQAVFYSQYLHIPVTLNGKLVEVLRGTKVADLARYESSYRPGDLFDVTGAKLEEHGGKLPIVIDGNGRVERKALLTPGVSLRIFPGVNAFEEASSEIVSQEQKLTISGKGPVWVRTVDGFPGKHIVRTGLISHRAASFDIYPPRDSRYERLTADQAKYIAFTFDDGPSSPYTLQMLNVLKANNVKGTFFVVGSRAEHYPWLIRAMVKDGHTIGNHSYSHVELTKVDEKRIHRELTITGAAVKSAGGGELHFFRPPYGSYNGLLMDKVDELNYTQVMWSIDTRDWTGLRAETIYAQTLDHLRPGSVVLMHDGGGRRAESVKALAMLLPKLKELGYTVVTMDEMMRLINEKRAESATSDQHSVTNSE